MLTPVPPNACQRARAAVSIQLDGELSEIGAARLAAHLRECEACAGYALEVAAITTRLRAARLEAPSAAVVVPSRRRRPALQVAAGAAAAVAALSAALAVGHVVGSSGRTPVQTRTAAGVPTLQQDIVSQHILALERRLPSRTTLRVGPLLML